MFRKHHPKPATAKKQGHNGMTYAFFIGVVLGMLISPRRNTRVSFGDNNNYPRCYKEGEYHWDESMGDGEVKKVD